MLEQNTVMSLVQSGVETMYERLLAEMPSSNSEGDDDDGDNGDGDEADGTPEPKDSREGAGRPEMPEGAREFT